MSREGEEKQRARDEHGVDDDHGLRAAVAVGSIGVDCDDQYYIPW